MVLLGSEADAGEDEVDLLEDEVEEAPAKPQFHAPRIFINQNTGEKHAVIWTPTTTSGVGIKVRHEKKFPYTLFVEYDELPMANLGIPTTLIPLMTTHEANTFLRSEQTLKFEVRGPENAASISEIDDCVHCFRHFVWICPILDQTLEHPNLEDFEEPPSKRPRPEQIP